MDRREFIKIASAAGLAVGSTSLYSRARAGLTGDRQPQEAPYELGMFCVFQAVGGWDPVHLCDPKGNSGTVGTSYGEGEIISGPGDIRFAPIPGAQEFVDLHGSYMTVVNGMDIATNSHDAGRRNMNSGRLAEGYPNLAALVAGSGAAHLPMSFLTFGGYEYTGATVPPTRDGNQDRITELAYPDQTNPGDTENPQYYHVEPARELIADAIDERRAALSVAQKLPRFKNSLNTLILSSENADQLKLLDELMPEPDPNAAFRRIQLAVAAYAAGICATANFAMGGYDTHSNHIANHLPRLTNLMAEVNFLFAEAERQGVAEQVTAMMASDFGRTPMINGGAGKDHWSVSSMVLLGQYVQGGRVVGMSDEGHRSIAIDPDTLAPAETEEAGVIPTPAHVHMSIRRRFGVEDNALGAIYKLDIEKELDVLGT